MLKLILMILMKILKMSLNNKNNVKQNNKTVKC